VVIRYWARCYLQGLSTMSAGKCVLIFLALFIASMVMQFVRAKKRQRIVRQVDRTWLSTPDQVKWNSVNESYDFLFKDFRKLQIVKRNAHQLPEDLVIELGRYMLFGRLETLVTVSMLMFAAFAYSFCN